MTSQGITWFHHASCLIEKNGKVVYIDPWELPEKVPPADLVLITHEHFDHYSPADIKKVWQDKTVLVVPQSMLGKVQKKAHHVKPGDKITLNEIPLEVVPAYNEKKSFHPRASQWVGYIVEIGSVRYYHSGDTDYIPEMKNIKADVVFLPVGGTYTMDAESAAKAAKTIQPQIAIPIHWGKLVGSNEDASLFAQKFPNAKVLKMGEKL